MPLFCLATPHSPLARCVLCRALVKAAETERSRVTAAEAKLSSAAGPTASSSKGASAWPEKQPNVGLAFSKQGSGGVVGAKKKMVIKLKKKP